MKFERFEDIMAWKKAKELVLKIYRDSVMNNIAEGYERGSNPDFKRFLFMAKGSSGEIRSMAYVALELSYINKEQFNEIRNLAMDISRMISVLIKKL